MLIPFPLISSPPLLKKEEVELVFLREKGLPKESELGHKHHRNI